MSSKRRQTIKHLLYHPVIAQAAYKEKL